MSRLAILHHPFSKRSKRLMVCFVPLFPFLALIVGIEIVCRVLPDGFHLFITRTHFPTPSYLLPAILEIVISQFSSPKERLRVRACTDRACDDNPIHRPEEVFLPARQVLVDGPKRSSCGSKTEGGVDSYRRIENLVR